VSGLGRGGDDRGSPAWQGPTRTGPWDEPQPQRQPYPPAQQQFPAEEESGSTRLVRPYTVTGGRTQPRYKLALEALEILARLFGVQRETVMRELQTVHSHDWSADSFSRGAYSYIPAGLVNSQQELAEPVQETLFFAGEATSLDSQLGTVHGAISSGNRAARQVIQSILARKTVD